jgi:hypothetical protein
MKGLHRGPATVSPDELVRIENWRTETKLSPTIDRCPTEAKTNPTLSPRISTTDGPFPTETTQINPIGPIVSVFPSPPTYFACYKLCFASPGSFANNSIEFQLSNTHFWYACVPNCIDTGPHRPVLYYHRPGGTFSIDGVVIEDLETDSIPFRIHALPPTRRNIEFWSAVPLRDEIVIKGLHGMCGRQFSQILMFFFLVCVVHQVVRFVGKSKRTTVCPPIVKSRSKR